VALFALTVLSRVAAAYYLANDAPGDGVIYARLAKNLFEHNVYSIEEEAPYTPTLIRLPGYPIFIACVYSVFGHDNNTAVRIVQAVVDSLTCILAAILAWLWSSGTKRRRRRKAVFAFLLAALCPFIAIYDATILTETLTTFLMTAMALTATLAIRTASTRRSFVGWIATGLLAGMAVMLRPDSGLFALGLGFTLVISGVWLSDRRFSFFNRARAVVLKGIVFSAAFAVILTPWTVRNYRLFGVFQPLAPAHAEMPGEFVAHGYFHWLRTWVDDSRFTEPMLWNLDEKPIRMESIPASAFDTPDERARVAALLDQYNNPPGSNNPKPADSEDDTSDESADAADESSDETPDENADESQDDTNSEGESDDDDENAKFVVKMTPEIDAAFEQIAEERIERDLVRYYLWLPVKRAGALWFDSHSLYYPFGGQMSPISDLDYDVSQQYWLPALTLLTWIYTLLTIGGVLAFWKVRSDRKQLRWLILILLMTLPRIIFFATIENPEPRYVVELFFFTAILGGIFIGGWKRPGATGPLPERIVSLDVFRGITIAAMTLVNEPGTWSAVYPPLLHAEWNGATPTDWIFPFFLFIVGVSIAVAFKNRTTGGLYSRILKRGILLFALGLALEAFPFYNLWTAAWFEPGELRVMGILQRIAICYVVAAIIFLKTNWKTQAAIVAGILLGYWALMTLVNVPGCAMTSINDQTCNLAAYVDRVVLTTHHIWNQSKVFDPEGLLATLPAIATTLLGVLAGAWLKTEGDEKRKTLLMIAAGVGLVVAGWLWSLIFPFNKTLWTSSYVVYTAGLALVFLASLYWLVDLKGYRKWSLPFVVFGTNAIALYVGTTVFGKALDIVELAGPHDTTRTLQEAIFNGVFLRLAIPMNASLMYAVAFVVLWLGAMAVLYWRRIFLKI
jgi:predicted acyltransferase